MAKGREKANPNATPPINDKNLPNVPRSHRSWIFREMSSSHAKLMFPRSMRQNFFSFFHLCDQLMKLDKKYKNNKETKYSLRESL